MRPSCSQRLAVQCDHPLNDLVVAQDTAAGGQNGKHEQGEQDGAGAKQFSDPIHRISFRVAGGGPVGRFELGVVVSRLGARHPMPWGEKGKSG